MRKKESEIETHKEDGESVVKSFCIDLNWDAAGRAASPGLYSGANAEEHVKWYRDLGANTIQTFCVSYNGYAWFPSDVAPVTPGMKGNFLQEQVELGHRHDMRVMGYFCLGSNIHWETWRAPTEVHKSSSSGWPVALTEKYLDYFCASVEEALQKTGIHGFMIDWFDRTCHSEWLDCEKHMWRQLMGEVFPSTATPPEAEILEYDRRSLDLAWRRIKATVDAVRPAIIWTNHPFRRADDPLWNGHRLLKEVDWVLNEAPDTEFLNWLEGQIGPHTKIIQNLCGWEGHNAGTILDHLDPERYGLYGFAAAHSATTLPWTLEQAQACERFVCKEKQPIGPHVNALNIGQIRDFYHSVGNAGKAGSKSI